MANVRKISIGTKQLYPFPRTNENSLVLNIRQPRQVKSSATTTGNILKTSIFTNVHFQDYYLNLPEQW